jgi:hypothetical protein
MDGAQPNTVDGVMIPGPELVALARREASGETDVCTAKPEKDMTMRHLHTKFLGASLLASVGLTIGAVVPAFASTTPSLPNVDPIGCPAGLVCTGSGSGSSSGSSGAVVDGHDKKQKPAPKPKHDDHKKPKHTPPPNPHADSHSSTYVNAPDASSIGVKWH